MQTQVGHQSRLCSRCISPPPVFRLLSRRAHYYSPVQLQRAMTHLVACTLERAHHGAPPTAGRQGAACRTRQPGITRAGLAIAPRCLLRPGCGGLVIELSSAPAFASEALLLAACRGRGFRLSHSGPGMHVGQNAAGGAVGRLLALRPDPPSLVPSCRTPRRHRTALHVPPRLPPLPARPCDFVAPFLDGRTRQ